MAQTASPLSDEYDLQLSTLSKPGLQPPAIRAWSPPIRLTKGGIYAKDSSAIGKTIGKTFVTITAFS